MTAESADEVEPGSDVDDPGQRDLFHVPPAAGGSLPRSPTSPATRSVCNRGRLVTTLIAELAAWERLGVEGHLERTVRGSRTTSCSPSRWPASSGPDLRKWWR